MVFAFFDKVPAYLNKYRWLTFLKNCLYFYEVEFKLDDHLAGKQSKICNFNCSSGDFCKNFQHTVSEDQYRTPNK